MSNRRALGVIAAAVLLVGFVLAVLPLSLDARFDGEQISCGTAFSGDTADAERAARINALTEAFSTGIYPDERDGFVAACEDRISTQRMIAFPLMGVGVLVLLFLGLTRMRTTEDEPVAPSTP